MNIIPCINLVRGQCVHVSGRLLDHHQIFNEDPVDQAGRWMDQGVTDLYFYDVEGTVKGEPVHRDLIISIAQRFPNLALHVEGGVRRESDIEAYLGQGIKSLTIGTKAVEDPAFVVEMCKRFPGKLLVSLMMAEGRVLTNGGQTESSIAANVWVSQLSSADLLALVYRDINRLGTSAGVNLEEAVKLAKVSRIPLWVSGGVADMDDIRALYAESDAGLETILVSRALDEKVFSLKEALDYCED
jgi:phosphoribosylformimino-5-aminoimidazole carboxamide ribotide isomerase